jgi:hypothetical protein
MTEATLTPEMIAAAPPRRAKSAPSVSPAVALPPPGDEPGDPVDLVALIDRARGLLAELDSRGDPGSAWVRRALRQRISDVERLFKHLARDPLVALCRDAEVALAEGSK